MTHTEKVARAKAADSKQVRSDIYSASTLGEAADIGVALAYSLRRLEISGSAMVYHSEADKVFLVRCFGKPEQDALVGGKVVVAPFLFRVTAPTESDGAEPKAAKAAL